MTTNPADWAYMAGILDGEGSFSITRTYLKQKSGRRYPAYDCKVMVGNTSVALLVWMHERFGGKSYLSVTSISRQARSWGQKSLRPCYRWYADGHQLMEQVILGVLPYLVIKREQAETCLEFVRMTRVKNPAKRAQLYQRNIALNKAKSVETNTFHPLKSASAVKIESELTGDSESAPTVM